MADISIDRIINISVAEPQAGLNDYNTSNLALFSNETAESSFGTDGYKQYSSPTEVATDFGGTSRTYLMAVAVFSQQPNILRGGGRLIVITKNTGETLAGAISRTAGSVEYFAAISTELETQANTIGASSVAGNNRKILGVVSRTASDLDDGDFFDTVKDMGFDHTRCLYHGGSEQEALNFLAAYFGRALSTNFNAVLSTQTMNLKDLIGVEADTSLTETLITNAQNVGADLYSYIRGSSRVPKVYTSGANGFFDDVYNLQWLQGALRIAGFNFLARTSTKIPQTESGMDGYKSAYKSVLDLAILNGFLAPGEWTSTTTFGDQDSFFRSIRETGYYVYSRPVSLQSIDDREDRKAPDVQIAIKYAGAIHSSSVIININR